VVLIRCGQDYKAASFAGIVFLRISCPEFNGTDTKITVYKNGVKINGFTGTIWFGPSSPLSDDDFGTYTFVAENKCGRDIAVTRIIREGLCLYE